MSENSSGAKVSRRRALMVAVVVCAVLMVAILVNGQRRRLSGAGGVDGEPVFVVQRGPLTISVSVSGTIKPREQEIIKNEVEGQAAILWLVDEGVEVKQGDLLVELDATKLVDDKVDQEIRVQNAEATFIGARENFEVTKNQAESDVDKARLALQFAEEDLKNYIDGEFPKQLMEVEARIALARGNKKRADDELAGSKRLAAKEFVTTNELEIDEQAALKAQLDLDLAESDKQLLLDFTYKRNLAQLESDAKQARMALERVERKASADIVQAEADLKAKESEFGRQTDKLTKTVEQIEKAKVRAPTDGLVVYATTGQGGGFRHSSVEPLDEGQVVRERQELIHLPTASSFLAEVQVHEASLAKVTVGLPVHITVDALPDRSFRGRVASVAPLPDAQSAWINPDLKVYDTEIHIEGDVTGLRTGMSCLAEIIVAELEDATYVPIQAVVRENGRPTVYVADAHSSKPRAVEIAMDNNRMVQIVSGLEPGEGVLLAPPLSSAKREGGGRLPSAEETPEVATAPEAPEAPEAETPPGAASAADRPLQRPPSEASDAPGDDERRREGLGGPPGAADFERFRNATPEEREKMRQEMQERLKNMSPEEQEAMRQRRRQRSERGEGEGGRP